MKRLLVLVLLSLDSNRAFLVRHVLPPTASCRQLLPQHSRTSLCSSSKKQQESKTRQKHLKRQRSYSPEYQSMLETLSNSANRRSTNTKQLLPRLSLPEQTDLIRQLSQRRKYSEIVHYAQQHSSATEAAILALSRASSAQDRSKALKLWNDTATTNLLTPRACVALFSCVDSASEAVSLMDRLQVGKNANKLEVWNAAIYACSRDRRNHNTNWQMALRMVQDMRKRRLEPNERTYANLIYACAQAGQVRIVLQLLQDMKLASKPLRSPHVWGAVLDACAKAGSVEQALQVLHIMQEQHVDINTVHCSALLSALTRAGKDELALEILENMHTGADTMLPLNITYCVILKPVPVDLVVINTVLAACAKAGNFTRASELLQDLKNGKYGSIEPDVISYNTVLSACNDPSEAKALVQEMRMSRRHRYGAVPPSTITYTHAITACRATADVESARLFLDMARDDGIQPNVYMYSAAIWCARNGNVALGFLDEMRAEGCSPNVVSYNGILAALAAQGRAEEALSLFEEMKDENLQPTRITYQRLASAIRISMEDISRSEMLEHVLSLMSTTDRRTSVGGSILEALIRQYGAGGKYEEASRVFKLIQGPTDAYCLRAMLYACSASTPPQWEEALSILHTSDIVEGTRGPAKVDSKALSYAMLACAKADQWQEALNLVELYGRAYSTKRAMDPNETSGTVTLPAFNAVIAACGRCGQPGAALRLLNEMESVFGVSPDERTYRKAIIACNQAEHDKRRRQRRGLDAKEEDDGVLQWWECSLSLLRRMKENNLKMDPQTYSSVISACEAAGQWQRALGVLQSMMKTDAQVADDYSGLNLYCFNAAISACEKGGAWVEALELFYRMKDKGGAVTPNFVTLNSLLVALDGAGQKELAQSTYEEGVRDGIVTPWKLTKGSAGGQIRAMDLHRFSGAMANAAIRSVMESLLSPRPVHNVDQDLVVIVGKGQGSEDKPVLLQTVRNLLHEYYQLTGEIDSVNAGRFVIPSEALQSFVERKQWR